MQHGLFWKDGIRFSCTQCSACCRYDPGFVYLSPHDLDSLQEWSSLDRPDFIRKFCRWVLQGDGYEYILWNNGCIAYNYRPFQCSSYPFWDYLLESERRWNINARSCPGINCGKQHSAEEIRGVLDTAKRFPIIRRKKLGEENGFTEK